MAVLRKTTQWKMRISFDLDEVLFVSPLNHKTEPPLRYPLNKLFPERLRLGTVRLVADLQKAGYEVWVYTSSFRSEQYIRTLFRCYGVRFDGIVNGQRHIREVQKNRPETLPQKLPNYYKISLHVDDEAIVATYGKLYGFDVFQLDAQDDEWAEKVLERAEQIRRKQE